MSSPMEQSPSLNELLNYAPKWVRDLETDGKARPHPHRSVGNATAADSFADQPSSHPDRPDSEVERFHGSISLGPSLVPPPPSEPKLQSRGRSSGLDIDDGGNRTFLGFFLAVFLAALAASIIVLAGPYAYHLVMKSKAGDASVAPRADRKPKAPPTGAARASAPASIQAERSNFLPQLNVESLSGAPRRPANAAIGTVAWPTAKPQSLNPSVWTNPPPAEPESRSARASAPWPAAKSQPAGPGTAVIPTAETPRAPDIAPSPAAKSHPAEQKTAVISAAEAPRLSIVATRPVESAEPPPQKSLVRRLGRSEIKLLMKQGNNFVSVGDFSSARVVFRRIAEAGDARGALALAATYDPIALNRIGAKGVIPDTAKAREWYRKAARLGSKEATLRLDALINRAQ